MILRLEKDNTITIITELLMNTTFTNGNRQMIFQRGTQLEPI